MFGSYRRLFTSLPHPPLFSTVYQHINVMGACLLWGVGAHGWVVRFCQPTVPYPSWSWLLIVEAPGCQHSDTFCHKFNCIMMTRVRVK